MRYALYFGAALLFASAALGSSSAADIAREHLDMFEMKIRPVLVERCYQCHSAAAAEKGKLQGGLQLDTRAGIRRGGDSGAAVVPGNVEESLLISALRHDAFEMPPKKKLPEAVIGDFVRWVKFGAPDPRDGKVAAGKYAIDFAEARRRWAFTRPQRHRPPQVKQGDWPRDPLDHFVLARMEEQDLKPVADADRRVLIRRLYFDLIGLPPSPQDVEEFLADKSPDAVEKLVDRLLDSRHFGERWGRHWLDVARYAESNGPPKVSRWPISWRYRDWVIAAFNRDMPYDEFVLRQVAGDLLPAESDGERDQNIIATGFLAFGVKVPRKRMDTIDEQMDAMGKALLGMTIGCARCHDHKFDPLATRDYYALAGIFINSEPQDPTGSITRARHLRKDIDKKSFNAYKKWIQSVGSAEGNIRERTLEIRTELRSRGIAYDLTKTLDENVAALSDKGLKGKLEKRLDDIRKSREELKKLRNNPVPLPPVAIAVHETGVKGRMANSHIHIRGSEKNLGDEVPRGLPQVFFDSPPEIAEDESGRLTLARLIASRDNPLTARVIVNRVWHHLMGRGIVRTVDNFGKLGEEPTHPELLDTLAVDFMEDGWSIKRLIRRIILSRTYQLSSDHDPTAMKTDPAGELLWRHPSRRLDAEALRDFILTASGRIDLEPMEGSLVKGFGSYRDAFNIDLQSKRSLYMPVLRGGTPPILAVFNFPPSTVVAGRRMSTTVPTQTLTLLNSPWVIEQAEFMALRLLDAKVADSAARIDLAYRIALARPANDAERERVMTFLADYQAALSEGNETDSSRYKLEAWTAFCQSLLGSGQFLWVR